MGKVWNSIINLNLYKLLDNAAEKIAEVLFWHENFLYFARIIATFFIDLWGM